MSDLLIVKVKSGINVKADLMDYWRKEILRQKETGVVMLPWFLDAVVVPEDVEIEELSCTNCKSWILDNDDPNRRCKYCVDMDEWKSK